MEFGGWSVNGKFEADELCINKHYNQTVRPIRMEIEIPEPIAAK